MIDEARKLNLLSLNDKVEFTHRCFKMGLKGEPEDTIDTLVTDTHIIRIRWTSKSIITYDEIIDLELKLLPLNYSAVYITIKLDEPSKIPIVGKIFNEMNQDFSIEGLSKEEAKQIYDYIKSKPGK